MYIYNLFHLSLRYIVVYKPKNTLYAYIIWSRIVILKSGALITAYSHKRNKICIMSAVILND